MIFSSVANIKKNDTIINRYAFDCGSERKKGLKRWEGNIMNRNNTRYKE